MATYTITTSKVWKPIWDSRWFYIQIIILFGVLLWFAGNEFVPLIIFILFVTIPLLLQLILQLNYLHHDRKVQLSVNFENKEISYLNGSKQIVIRFENIKSITRFQGSKYPKTFEPYSIPSNFYHYTVIKSIDGNIIIISDFICSELGIYFPNKQLEIRPFLNVMRRNYR